MLEEGIKRLLLVLERYLDSSNIASVVCCALFRAARANSTAVIAILTSCRADNIILRIAL